MEHLDNERIQILMDGALDEAERAQVEEHLAHCALCTQELKVWEALFAPLNALPELEPGSRFESELLARLGIEPWWAKFFARPIWPKAALAGVMVVMAGWIAIASQYLPNLLSLKGISLLTLPAKVSRGASGAFFQIVHGLGSFPSLVHDLGFYLKIVNAILTGVNQPAVWGALFLLMTFSLYIFRVASTTRTLGNSTRRNTHGYLTTIF